MMSTPVRFSDDELKQFHRDFVELAQNFERHEADEASKYDQLIRTQQENAQAIRELTVATTDMVAAWQAAQGAVKFGATLGRFVRWVTSIAVVGGFFAWLFNHTPGA